MPDEVKSSSALRVSAVFLGTIVALLFLWTTRSIFLTAFVALLFAVSIMPIVDRMQRFRIPRGIGAAIVVAAVLGVLAAVGALLSPVLQEQGGELRQRIPAAIQLISNQLAKHHISLGNVAAGQGGFEKQIGNVIPYLFPVFSTTVTALAAIILILFLTIFFAADPLMYERGLLHLVPRRHRQRGTQVMKTIAHSLRSWVVARSVAMVTIGIVVTGTMALLHVRAFVALGVIAGLLEFVPVFGPILGAIPAIVLALADSPEKALWVAIAFLIIQQLEGNVLIPMLLQKAVEVPPALSLIGIACMTIVLGVAGALIAEPLVAAGLVVVKMLYVEPVIGDKMAAGDEEQ
jgi:predicted PurR-regulated permease PerM